MTTLKERIITVLGNKKKATLPELYSAINDAIPKSIRGIIWASMKKNENIFVKIRRGQYALQITATRRGEDSVLKKQVMLFGLEFETSYPANLSSIPSGSYHSALKMSKFWRAERDGSLHGNNYADHCVELTTIPFQYAKLYDVIADLRMYVKKKYNITNFADFFKINQSMGHHIHFSLKDKRMTDTAYIKLFECVRKTFFKRLQEYNPRLYEVIKKQYFRYYAKKLGQRAYMSRYYEFNLSSETQGFEWRSFNVLGVTTWNDYENVLRIGLESLKDCIDRYYNGKLVFKKSITIETPQAKNSEVVEQDYNIEIKKYVVENDDVNVEVE